MSASNGMIGQRVNPMVPNRGKRSQLILLGSQRADYGFHVTTTAVQKLSSVRVSVGCQGVVWRRCPCGNGVDCCQILLRGKKAKNTKKRWCALTQEAAAVYVGFPTEHPSTGFSSKTCPWPVPLSVMGLASLHRVAARCPGHLVARLLNRPHRRLP